MVTVVQKSVLTFALSLQVCLFLEFMKTAHSTHCFVTHISSVNGQI